MMEYHNSRPARIIGPQAEVLTIESLPPAGTTRWVASRKAQIVAAVNSGLLTIDEVRQRYRISFEEFYSWQHAMDCAGVAGLRIAWLQEDRADRRRHHRHAPAKPRRELALA